MLANSNLKCSKNAWSVFFDWRNLFTQKFSLKSLTKKNWCVHNRRTSTLESKGWPTIVRFGKSLEKFSLVRPVDLFYRFLRYYGERTNGPVTRAWPQIQMSIKYLNFKLGKHLICAPFAGRPSGCANDQNFKVRRHNWKKMTTRWFIVGTVLFLCATLRFVIN